MLKKDIFATYINIMNKILSILFATFISFIVFSCTSPDPAALYGLTPNDPNNPGANIAGPRILHKVQFNNLPNAEYTSAGGVLNEADFYHYDGNNLSEHNKVILNYSGNEISSFEWKVIQSSNSGSMTEKIYPTYDATGKIINFIQDRYLGTVHVMHIKGTLIYNSANLPIEIIQKIHNPDPFNPGVLDWGGQQINTTILYTGSNVVKVKHEQKLYDTTTNTLLNNHITLYEYSQYDDKISPYSTLSKDYRLIFAQVHPAMLFHLSYNNALKTKITFPMAPPIEGTGSFQYDQQNYAIAVTGGNLKYIYKPIQ
ncbi:hypothetical protein EIZ46_10360 [Chryseobacterium lacus]|nr:hypothetical protein EIZ46_10360 [Chryseobacterium lacus]